MDETPVRTTFRHRRGANNIRPLNPIEYTVRTGFSASDIRRHRDSLNPKLLKSRAYSLAKKKAKADGHENYAMAIPSLHHECGYRIGELREFHRNITSKDITMWSKYCYLQEMQQRQSESNTHVQLEEPRLIESNISFVAKWILYTFAAFIALVFLNSFL